MDRLSPLDASFVEAEDVDPHTSMAIASIAVFEGPAPDFDEFVETIESRLHLVPRYRQRLRQVPSHLGPPVWVDDPSFDVRYHIRETALPAPGSEAELCTLMGRLMSERLDRDRPLWEDWLVTGLAGGRWAMISKVHHCMVDGVSGTDLYRVMFDTGEEQSTSAAAAAAVGRPPSTWQVLAQAFGSAVALPWQDGWKLVGAARHPRRVAHETAEALKAFGKLAGALPPASKSSLSGPIGPHRRYTVARVPLDDVKAVKAALGGTVNDVILAAIASGFRDLLLSRGEHPDRKMVPSLVPVSLRAPGEESIYENRVSAMIVHLPVDLDRPVDRLSAVRAEMSTLKATKEALAGAMATSFARFLPYSVSSLSRLAFRLPQREIVTVTTNVPGPRDTLHCLGRPLVEILPYVPIATTLRIGVAIFSYCDRISFGITGDYDSAPDIDVLARGIEAGVADLLAVVRPDHVPLAAAGR